jgi:hypothetical protein
MKVLRIILLVGFLSFSSLIILYEIIGGIRYERYIKSEIENRKFHNQIQHNIFGDPIKSEEEIIEELDKEIRVKGNPYSLFK